MTQKKNVEPDHDPCDNFVCVEDITGYIGEWLDKDYSDVPLEAVKHLKQAYEICVRSLEEKNEQQT